MALWGSVLRPYSGRFSKHYRCWSGLTISHIQDTIVDIHFMVKFHINVIPVGILHTM
jgi:hypothetical protein